MSYFCHLNCEFCEAVYGTARSLYWHLRKHHGFNHDEAFESVGNSISKSVEDFGHDDRTKAALSDRTYEGFRWKAFIERGTEKQQTEYFSKSDLFL